MWTCQSQSTWSTHCHSTMSRFGEFLKQGPTKRKNFCCAQNSFFCTYYADPCSPSFQWHRKKDDRRASPTLTGTTIMHMQQWSDQQAQPYCFNVGVMTMMMMMTTELITICSLTILKKKSPHSYNFIFVLHEERNLCLSRKPLYRQHAVMHPVHAQTGRQFNWLNVIFTPVRGY